jgi:DNA-binding protein HU-beta
VSERTIEQILNAFINLVQKEVSTGGYVQLMNFGTFKAITKKQRQGVNPFTKESMVIESKRVPKFYAGKSFQEAVKAEKT